MGLSNHLTDGSSGSIPILLLVAAATWVSYLRSLLIGLLHHHRRPLSSAGSADFSAEIGAGLAGLAVLADHLAANSAFLFPAGEESAPECVVCLCALRRGEHVRRLSCRHVFHSECLDGWFQRMNLSCPLCRMQLVAPECRADAERRIGAELVAWLPACC